MHFRTLPDWHPAHFPFVFFSFKLVDLIFFFFFTAVRRKMNRKDREFPYNPSPFHLPVFLIINMLHPCGPVL